MTRQLLPHLVDFEENSGNFPFFKSMYCVNFVAYAGTKDIRYV